MREGVRPLDSSAFADRLRQGSDPEDPNYANTGIVRLGCGACAGAICREIVSGTALEELREINKIGNAVGLPTAYSFTFSAGGNMNECAPTEACPNTEALREAEQLLAQAGY